MKVWTQDVHLNQSILSGSIQLESSPATKKRGWGAVSRPLSFPLLHSQQKVQGFCGKSNKPIRTSQWVRVLSVPEKPSLLPALWLWQRGLCVIHSWGCAAESLSQQAADLRTRGLTWPFPAAVTLHTVSAKCNICIQVFKISFETDCYKQIFIFICRIQK